MTREETLPREFVHPSLEAEAFTTCDPDGHGADGFYGGRTYGPPCSRLSEDGRADPIGATHSTAGKLRRDSAHSLLWMVSPPEPEACYQRTELCRPTIFADVSGLELSM